MTILSKFFSGDEEDGVEFVEFAFELEVELDCVVVVELVAVVEIALVAVAVTVVVVVATARSDELEVVATRSDILLFRGVWSVYSRPSFEFESKRFIFCFCRRAPLPPH